jgi:hypothetical protein
MSVANPLATIILALAALASVTGITSPVLIMRTAGWGGDTLSLHVLLISNGTVAAALRCISS